MTDNNDKTKLHKQVDRSHSYHRPVYQDTMDKMGLLRASFSQTGHMAVIHCPPSRELSLALTALDEANMWAIAALARHEPEGTHPNITSHPADQDEHPLTPQEPKAESDNPLTEDRER